MANLVKNVNFEKTGNPKEICHNPLTKQQIYSNMLVIRSLAKYRSLQLIEAMRIKIIDLARRKRIKNCFDLTLGELIEITKEMKELINKRASSLEIEKLAQKQGMITMRQDGMIKVIDGLTSLEEVERVV